MDDEGLSIADLLRPMRGKWLRTAAIGVAAGIVTYGATFAIKPSYDAVTTFTPISSSSSAGSFAGLANIAGQLGLGSALSSSGGNLSVEMCQAILGSRELLAQMLALPFRSPTDGKPRTLLDLLEGGESGGKPSPQRLEAGIRDLRKSASVRVDKVSGIVSVTVRLKSPELAADVANQMVQLLNSFNLERRQSQSRAQRVFAERRAKEAGDSLRIVEQAHQAFLTSNRTFDSPVLRAEEARLQRAEQLRSEVYTSLAKAVDEARIAELRDTPVLTIIDHAVPPDTKASPKRTITAAVAMLLIILAVIAATYVRVFVERERAHS